LNAAGTSSKGDRLVREKKGTFTAWSWQTQKGWCACTNSYHSYDYHVFLSYSTADEQYARDIAMQLVGWPYRIFYAPLSFPASGVDGNSSGGWTLHLEEALLSSIHFIFLTSSSYENSPWCELEYLAFHRLHLSNLQRGMIRYDLSSSDSLHGDYSAAQVVARSLDAVLQNTTQMIANCSLDVGQKISPDMCLGKLPLNDLSFPQGCTWDEFGQGNQYEPPYDVFQTAVRETMLLIRKGHSSDELSLREHSATLRSWSWDLVENVIFAAKTLLEKGVQPEG
jgi:hypothetical protein